MRWKVIVSTEGIVYQGNNADLACRTYNYYVGLNTYKAVYLLDDDRTFMEHIRTYEGTAR